MSKNLRIFMTAIIRRREDGGKPITGTLLVSTERVRSRRKSCSKLTADCSPPEYPKRIVPFSNAAYSKIAVCNHSGPLHHAQRIGRNADETNCPDGWERMLNQPAGPKLSR